MMKRLYSEKRFASLLAKVLTRDELFKQVARFSKASARALKSDCALCIRFLIPNCSDCPYAAFRELDNSPACFAILTRRLRKDVCVGMSNVYTDGARRLLLKRYKMALIKNRGEK